MNLSFGADPAKDTNEGVAVMPDAVDMASLKSE
jgi:hypothetical protein